MAGRKAKENIINISQVTGAISRGYERNQGIIRHYGFFLKVRRRNIAL